MVAAVTLVLILPSITGNASTYFDFRTSTGTAITTHGDGLECSPGGANCKYVVMNLGQPKAAVFGMKYYALNSARFNIMGSGCSSGALDIAVYNDAAYTVFDHAFGLTGSGTSPLPISSNVNFDIPADKYAQLIFGCNDGGLSPLTMIDGSAGSYAPHFGNTLTYTGLPNLCIGDMPADCGVVPEPSLVQLTNFPGENAIHPNWSPKGDLISFISNRDSGNGRMNDVWAVAFDGSNVHRLTAMPDDGFEGGTFDAIWIGSSGDLVVLDVNIFYEWLRLQLSTNPTLPVARTAFDGPSPSFQELLTIPGGLGGLSFAVSHDGQSVAWSAMVSSSCPWMTNAIVAPFSALNGQAITSVGSPVGSGNFGCGQIPKSEAIAGISFSPDASQIVLARASDPNVLGYDLEIYTTSGQLIRKLTNNGTGAKPVINWNPSWSSDGRIAFASNQTGRFEIYTINSDETNLQPITTNSGDWPTWSPDSSKIAFQSTRSGNSEIYSIPVKVLPPPPPILSISSNQLIFGNVPVGKSLELTVKVMNTGGTLLTGAAAASSPFTIISPGPISVVPGGFQTLAIDFAPTAAGRYLGTLSMTTNASDANVTLQGTGVQTQSFVAGQITLVVSSISAPLPNVPVVRLDKHLNFQEIAVTDVNGAYFLMNFAEQDYIVPVSSGASPSAEDVNQGVHGYAFSLLSFPNVAAFCQIGVPTASRKCEGAKRSPLGNFIAFPKPAQHDSAIMLHMPLPSGTWRVSVEAGGFAVTNRPIDADPSHTDISSGFYALDFPGACGTPVLAVVDGYVRFAGTNDSFGRTVVIEHSGGLFSRYAHLDSIPLKEIHPGAHVTQGQIIGYMGSTGLRVGGPHLHFQVYDGDFQPSDSQSADSLLRTIRIETKTGNLAFTDFIAGAAYRSTNGEASSTLCLH